MTYNIDSKTYAKLYAKYLHNDRTKEMVNLAGNLKGKRVLDLCCGGGRLTQEVLKQKTKQALSIDASFDMLQDNFDPNDIAILSVFNAPWNPKKYCCGCGTVKYALTDLKNKSLDVIFCQQAINYWFYPEHAEKIKKVLAPKGMFIFNTFNVKPSVIPRTKTYYYEKTGRNYTEVSWLVGDMVKHVQIAQGMDPHFTEFRWIPPEEFKRAFKRAGFKVTVQTDGATDIYMCRKG